MLKISTPISSMFQFPGLILLHECMIIIRFMVRATTRQDGYSDVSLILVVLRFLPSVYRQVQVQIFWSLERKSTLMVFGCLNDIILTEEFHDIKVVVPMTVSMNS